MSVVARTQAKLMQSPYLITKVRQDAAKIVLDCKDISSRDNLVRTVTDNYRSPIMKGLLEASISASGWGYLLERDV